MLYGPGFLYLWPPRPETAIAPMSPQFQTMKSRPNFIAQLKMNGQRNVLYFSPDGDIQWWNRHGGHHQNYTPPTWLEEEIRSVVQFRGKWIVIDGELLHNKDKTIKNHLYWWDILVLDNDYLVGKTLAERQEMLSGTLRPPVSETTGVFRLSEHISVARNILPEMYDEMWQQTEVSYIEGFVFKHLNAKLMPCVGKKNNSSWQVRCRKTHKGYAF